MIKAPQLGPRAGRRGFVLIALAVCAVVICGALGLAFDAGRLYVIRNEAQAFVDSAALAAALKLDGTQAGVAAATAAARASPNRWDFGGRPFAPPLTEFAAGPGGPWTEGWTPSTGLTHVRVAVALDVPTFFMPVVTGNWTTRVSAAAIAAQVPQTDFREGLAPFSPIAPDPAAPDFGMFPGEQYSLRWPPGNQNSDCRGDAGPVQAAQAAQRGPDKLGLYGDPDPAALRRQIETDAMAKPVAQGSTLELVAGDPAAEAAALAARARQDADLTSLSYAAYAANPRNNGRRLIVVPVSDPGRGNRVLGFAAFLLLPPDYYPPSGAAGLCAVFVGPYRHAATRPGDARARAFQVRLVQ